MIELQTDAPEPATRQPWYRRRTTIAGIAAVLALSVAVGFFAWLPHDGPSLRLSGPRGIDVSRLVMRLR